MNLKDFTKETLVQIVNGVLEANSELKDKELMSLLMHLKTQQNVILRTMRSLKYMLSM